MTVTIFRAGAAGGASAGITPVSGSPSTPSGVASVDFTSISGGNDLVATWTGVSCATASRALMVKPSIAGVFGGTDILKAASFNAAPGATPTAHITFTGAQSALSQAAANTCSGTLIIRNYASTSAHKDYIIYGKALTGASEVFYCYSGVFYNTSAIDGLRFFWSTGGAEAEQASNFDAGTINVGTRV